MPVPRSPSPILECFVRAAQRQFPESELAKLKAHDAAIQQTTSVGDGHRARRCAQWAIEKSDDPARSHPRWREIKELHQVWKDIWFGVEFSHYGRAHLGPIEDIRIQWTEDAVAVAKTLGDEDGWTHVPWEALLVELIGTVAPDDPDET
jgi:hypothetical protein